MSIPWKACRGEAWSLRGRTQFRVVGVTARTKKCLKGLTCVRFTPKMRVYALNCVTPAQRTFLPRRLHASPFLPSSLPSSRHRRLRTRHVRARLGPEALGEAWPRSGGRDEASPDSGEVNSGHPGPRPSGMPPSSARGFFAPARSWASPLRYNGVKPVRPRQFGGQRKSASTRRRHLDPELHEVTACRGKNNHRAVFPG